MALIKCPECNKEISDKAELCPHCGYKKHKKITKKTILSFFVIAFIVILCGVVLYFIISKVGANVNEKKAYNEYDELYSKTKQIMYEDAQKYQNYCKEILVEETKDPVYGVINYTKKNIEEMKMLWDNYETIETNMKKLKEIPEDSYQTQYNLIKTVFDSYSDLEGLTISVTGDYQEKCENYSNSFNEAYKLLNSEVK